MAWPPYRGHGTALSFDLAFIWQKTMCRSTQPRQDVPKLARACKLGGNWMQGLGLYWACSTHVARVQANIDRVYVLLLKKFTEAHETNKMRLGGRGLS